MSETLEQEKLEEQNALNDFKSGFDGTNEPPSDAVENDDQASAQAELPPEYVQVTKQEWESTLSRLNEIDNLKSAHAKTSGSIGTLHQVIEQLKAQTKPGAPVELTDDVVDGLKEQFGDELSAAVLGVLKKASPALRGTGQSFDPEQIKAQAKAEAEATYSAKRQAELESNLSEEHPDWKTIIHSQEFADWKKTQSPDVRKRIDTSRNANYAIQQLTIFKDSLKKKQEDAASEANKQHKSAQRGEVRRQTMQAAVQPRGDGGHASAKTAVDDFHAGFDSIAGKN